MLARSHVYLELAFVVIPRDLRALKGAVRLMKLNINHFVLVDPSNQKLRIATGSWGSYQAIIEAT